MNDLACVPDSREKQCRLDSGREAERYTCNLIPRKSLHGKQRSDHCQLGSSRTDESPRIVPVVHLHVHPLWWLQVGMNWLLHGRSLDHRLRGQWRACARSPPPFPLSDPGRVNLITVFAESAPQAADPTRVLVLSKPVATANADHRTAELSLPALALWSACIE